MRQMHNVSRNNRRQNPRYLIPKIQNPTQCPHTLPRSNQRRNRPPPRRSRRQSPNRHADPKNGDNWRNALRSSKNSKPKCRPANQHNLPHANRIPPTLNQRINKKSANQHIDQPSENPRDSRVKNRMQQIDMQSRRNVGRQPREQQIKSVVVRSKPKHKSPNLPLPQQIPKWRALRRPHTVLRLCTAPLDVFALGARQFLVFAGIPVEKIEQREVKQADDTGRKETPPPAEPQQKNSDERNSEARRKLCRRIEKRGRKAALLLWKPVTDGLRVRWKRRSFADPKQKTGRKQSSDARRDRRRKRSHAPDNCADSSD